MSVLGRRLAGTEGAYFFQESKHAVERLAAAAQKQSPNQKRSPNPVGRDAQQQQAADAAADVLPEILRHSLPLRHDVSSSSSSSFSTGSKWSLLHHHPDAAARPRRDDAINPLRDYVSLPQVTFGPKRWQLPNEHPSVSASTANELRNDRYTTTVDPEKLMAAAAGLSQIGKAFAIATVIVFGGAISAFVFTASKLQLQNKQDIKSGGRNFIQPKIEMVQEHMTPLRAWAENMSRKWRIKGRDEDKESPILKQLSKILGGRDF